LKIGPGSSEGMDMGPLVTAAHRDRVKGYIDAGAAACGPGQVPTRAAPFARGRAPCAALWTRRRRWYAGPR
jgi:acyl-CoA reductase-like NAD-dependent aldehyde dehydrogenase